jgi:hypothetical protein
MSDKTQKSAVFRFPALGGLLLLLAVLLFLFRGVLAPGHTLFANDGPLGNLMAECHRLPGAFTGVWNDLNTLGAREGGAVPDLNWGMLYVLGPVSFSKFNAMLTLVFLGAGAWTFFRQLGLSPTARLLGTLAASLNSSYFSAAAWGVATHALTVGFCFFALAALWDTTSRARWVRVCLAGLAVGMAVTEGADIGALFSLFVAAFVVYQSVITIGWGGKAVAGGIGRVLVVALFAGFMASQTISALVATQIQGVAGMSQEERSKQEKWDWATQWSLPKREALQFIVPGLFGYRMDTPDGGNYWGAAGRDPAWDRYFAGGKQGDPPQGFMRFSGGGVYAGVLVVLIAFWAMLQGFRKKHSVFPDLTRKWIWFWSVVIFVCLLLSFGRFAPFYQIIYQLPYFSTIRNPSKFAHILSWALVILFAYGVHGLWQTYFSASSKSAPYSFKAWWARVRGFDRRWTIGTGIAFGAAVLGWLVFSSSRKEFIEYLQEVQFNAEMAAQIAQFSSGQVGIWLFFFAGALLLLTLILSGAFSGPRAKWGAVLMVLFVLVDLGRANKPWIVVWDYEQKYATNPIIEKLREQPYLGRVAIMPSWVQQFVRGGADPQVLEQLYRIEWAQHHFLYYNIHSLDIIQMPRMPEDLLAFEMALQPRTVAELPLLAPRRWQLTSTRYLLGVADYLPFLNQQIDPAGQRFRIAERFAIQPKPGIERPTSYEELTAVPDTNGPYALIEFTGALPRAGLYTQWEVITNGQAVLKRMASAEFDPATTVIVPAPLPAASSIGTNTVVPAEFESWAPKHIALSVEAAADSVLLLNDRFDPNWRVYVDGSIESLLRPNHLMRGVFLKPGKHKVEFKFEPPVDTMYVTFAAWGVGLVLVGAMVVMTRPKRNEQEFAEKAEN